MNAEKFISVFEMFKVAVGPSSSHTLGPWRAAQMCMEPFIANGTIDEIQAIQVLLYGSLAKTGKGHGTDMAVLMGLLGEDPITIDTKLLIPKVNAIKSTKELLIGGKKLIPFNYDQDILFLKDKLLPHHPNALQFVIHLAEKAKTFTYYSIGGGFVESEADLFEYEKLNSKHALNLIQIDVPFNFTTTAELLHWCKNGKW